MKKLTMVFILSIGVLTMGVHANGESNDSVTNVVDNSVTSVGINVGDNIEHVEPMDSIELLNRLRTVESELDELEIMVDRLEDLDELDNMDSRSIQNNMGDVL